MNKVKEELRNVLEDEPRFTAQSEQQVFEKIAQKKERHSKWKIPAVVASFAAICALLFIFLPQTTEEQSTNPIVDVFVIDDTMDVIVNMVDVWQKHDALIAYTKKGQPTMVFTKYFVNEEGEWVQKYATTQDFEQEVNWVNDDRLYSGKVYTNNIYNVMLDDKIAIFIKDKIYWVGLADQPVAHVKYLHSDYSHMSGFVERVPQKYSFNHHVLTYVPAAPITQLNGTERMMYKADNMDRGDQQYTKYPIVINPNVKEFERGEVVRYINSDGEMVVSRIVGLPNESFVIKNGTILIDQFLLDMDLGYAKVDGFLTYEDYERANKELDVNFKAVKEIFAMDFNEIKLGSGEYVVVPDNWKTGQIEVVKAPDMRGKVLGYDGSVLADEWTASELALYEAFKKEYDLDVLVGSDPITIARLWEYARLLSDYETEYQLLTSRDDHVYWSYEEHLQNKEFEVPVNPKEAIDYAEMLADGEWIQTTDYEGYIKMDRENGNWLGFQMVQAENGAWEVGFLPIQ